MKNDQFTQEVIRCFFTVYNKLGYGFLEKVYENAMMIELKKAGFDCKRQQEIAVFYDGAIIGNYSADIIVDDELILELKAIEFLVEEHELQLINYLKATQIEKGLLLNFGKSPQIKRKIFSNSRKPLLNHGA